tara:strand:+ start:1371 stop:2186 length:816 start_codon:yes stop_codon:yes gene_type:complete
MTYEPLKKLSLEDVAINTTKKLIIAIRKVDHEKGNEVSVATFRKVDDAMQDIMSDFQSYLGTTDGDKASHWFDDCQIRPLIECSRHENIHEQLDNARHLLGADGGIVEISSELKVWLDHLVRYGNSCYDSLDDYACGHSTICMDQDKHPFPSHQKLLEMNLGLVPVQDEDNGNFVGLIYTLPDARGEEYGKWVFVPASRKVLGKTSGKPTKLEDGTWETDKDGRIIYRNPETFERYEDVIEVTKYGNDGAIGFDIPIGQFRSFFYEIAQLN